MDMFLASTVILGRNGRHIGRKLLVFILIGHLIAMKLHRQFQAVVISRGAFSVLIIKERDVVFLGQIIQVIDSVHRLKARNEQGGEKIWKEAGAELKIAL